MQMGNQKCDLVMSGTRQSLYRKRAFPAASGAELPGTIPLNLRTEIRYMSCISEERIQACQQQLVNHRAVLQPCPVPNNPCDTGASLRSSVHHLGLSAFGALILGDSHKRIHLLLRVIVLIPPAHSSDKVLSQYIRAIMLHQPGEVRSPLVQRNSGAVHDTHTQQHSL